MNRKFSYLLLVAAMLPLALLSPARSQSSTISAPGGRPGGGPPGSNQYSFTLIADTAPGSPYSDLGVGQAINDGGDVAYVASLRSGGQALFIKGADGLQRAVATTGAVIRAITLSPFLNNGGVVSFGATLTDGTNAIFTGDGSGLTRIADTAPGSLFSLLPGPAPRVGSDGVVTFHGTLKTGDKGLFRGDGGPPDILYVTGGEFKDFLGGPASQVSGSTIASRAVLQDGTFAEFIGDGGPPTIVATSGSNIRDFIGGEINASKTLAITVDRTAGGQAILVGPEGNLITFVDTTGPFGQFSEGRTSINNNSTVVFGAALKAGGSGLFHGPDPVSDRILAVGDPLFGSVVAAFPANFFNPRGLNSDGQLVFRANLADGRRVVVRADPR